MRPPIALGLDSFDEEQRRAARLPEYGETCIGAAPPREEWRGPGRRQRGEHEHRHRFPKPRLAEFINEILERELSGYRFVSGRLTDITSAQELEMLDLLAVRFDLYGSTPTLLVLR